jgi:hypothetical protein
MKIKLPEIDKSTFPHEYVQVWWSDINSDASWLSEEKARQSKPTVCVSTGWLLSKKRRVHILCADINFNDDGTVGDVGNVTTIPTCNVIKVRKIKI